MGPKTIVPRKGRQYANGAEWKGAGFNGINGEPENGLEGYLFERFIGVEASKAKAGGVLDPHTRRGGRTLSRTTPPLGSFCKVGCVADVRVPTEDLRELGLLVSREPDLPLNC